MSRSEDLRVVAFGGGTGLPVLLRGLRDRVGALAAVVTVADDGGSSGRIRQELGVAPPGDVRNCLVALAGRRRLAEVFNYRFEGGGDLSDHSVGNIIIAALADMAGGFAQGVDQAARFLRIKGRVFPAAVESLILVAHYADGAVVRGESAVSAMHAREGEEMLKVVEEADVVVLSSGSLYTSTIPSLLGGGTREALESFSGPVVYIANVMTQPGETTGFAVSDHLKAISDHVGSVVTDVLVHSGGLPEEAVERYEAEGAAPVVVDREEIKALGVRVWESDLIYHGDFSRGVRHDPRRLAEEVCEVALVRL
jgi:uncharacterized cofD-like protein